MLLLDRADRLDRYVRMKLPAEVQRVVAPEDVLQEVWTTAYRRVSSFQASGPDDFDRWLTRLTESRIIDALRYARRLKRKGSRNLEHDAHRRTASYMNLFGRLVSKERTPSSEDAVKEAVQAVQVAVAGLPESYRSAVTLHHLHGQTRTEIANALGKTPSAINSLLYRGLRELRARLGRAERFFSDDTRPRTSARATGSERASRGVPNR